VSDDYTMGLMEIRRRWRAIRIAAARPHRGVSHVYKGEDRREPLNNKQAGDLGIFASSARKAGAI